MSKTYSKVHKSDNARRSHKSKVINRGGIVDRDDLTATGAHKIKYHFPKKG